MLKRSVAISTVAILTTLLLISGVNASFTKSIPYNVFENLGVTFYETDKTYDTGFTAKITNNLVWNNSVNPDEYALVRLTTNNSDTAFIEVGFYEAGTTRLYYSYDGSTTIPITDYVPYNSSYPVIVSLDSDGFLDFIINNNEVIVDDFTYGNLTLNYIGAHGGTNETTGYVQVYITSAIYTAKGMQESIYTWMPTIISFAMLGAVLGIVKKYAK